MDRSRWNQLRDKGWKEGTVADFLGLKPEEAAYIELKLQLGDAVKALRLRRGITQVELAKRLGSSQSRVAKIEASDPSVSIDLLTRSLLALGASKKDIARAIASPTRRRSGRFV